MVDEEFSFPTYMGDIIRVQVVGQDPSKLTHEQRVRGQVAAREIRLGVQWNFGPIVRAAQQLHDALHQRESFFGFPQLDTTFETRGFLEQLVEKLEFEFESGRLVVTEGAFPLLGIPPEFGLAERERLAPVEPPLPSIARAQSPDKLTFFEVRFVDEIGKAIGGLEVELKAGQAVETATTNPAGVATLDDVVSMSGSVSVLDIDALGDIVEPRWEAKRPGTPPQGVNTKSFAFTGAELKGLELKPAVPNTVVITPPLGKLFLRLLDKTGRIVHDISTFRITGPQNLDGETDADGRLLFEQVLPGNYELELDVDINRPRAAPAKGKELPPPEPEIETYKSPLVVLDSSEATPQARMIGVIPYVMMARLRGMLFDTNKCFILPTAIEALQQIRYIYAQNDPSELLIVGHTDTTAEPDINDPLSVERAGSLRDYLNDDVDAWLKNYELPGKKQWGSREDRLMIAAMRDFASRTEDEDVIEWFQRTRKLEVDGIAGPDTRTQLIDEYMQLDCVDFEEDAEFDINITVHGAGENFPLKDTGFELDEKAANEKEDAFDRRVELFFFDEEFGIRPKAGAADGPEYLEWRRRSLENKDFPIEGIGRRATVIECHDALFRLNSSVVLPEGEAPGDEHQALTSVGIFAGALRVSDERPGKKLFIAGHTDTSATVDFNQKLSEERARCVLALLVDDRQSFVSLADGRHTVGDYKQILSWCTKAFPGKFDCDPGAIDDNAATGVEPLKKFQANYNEQKATLGVPEGTDDLAVDGEIGPETWGGMFDVYQFGIREELGEDQAGVDKLRSGLAFVDLERKSLGFSEHHPVDQIGRDGVRSQSNRRVELLFFDKGEEPDLVLAESDPDISELYLPAEYEHQTITLTSAKKGAAILVGVFEPTEDIQAADSDSNGAGDIGKEDLSHIVPADTFDEVAA